MLTETTIHDLISDDQNPNRGTERGRDAVQHSIESLGAGRSVLVDRNGKIIAGNKTVEAALAAGMEDLITVETDGTKLVAVKRTDLDLENDPKARELSIVDNRTAELGLEWDSDVLKEMSGDLDLTPYFDASELKEITEDEQAAEEKDLGAVPDLQFKVLVICKDEAHQAELLQRFGEEGLECSALTL